MRDGHRTPGNESLVLRSTGLIVICGVVLAGAATLAAILSPTLFEGPSIRAPFAKMTVAEQLQLAQAQATQRNGARDTGLKVAAGIGALTAAMLAWGRMEISRDERRLGRASHLADRYSKAVEQLGHSTSDIQLGGVYALEQLGVDSQQHRGSVIEVLCAYVREHSCPVLDDDGTPLRQPATAQAALDVLGRNHAEWYEHSYSLTKADLRGADLRGLDFSACDFSRSDLSGVHLDEADLAGARFNEANLEKATLSNAILVEATLPQAKMSSGSLHGAIADGASFFGADLTGADLSGGSFRGSLFTRATLATADLFGADVSDATFYYVDLSNVELDSVAADGTTWPDGFSLPPSKLTSGSRAWRDRGYSLENAAERNAQYPDSFQIPTEAERTSLTPGLHAKLLFVLAARGRTARHVEPFYERMWVQVTQVQGHRYTGVLVNTPIADATDLQAGHLIYFGPEQIADIAEPTQPLRIKARDLR